MAKQPQLYKTTLVIWSEFDGSSVEIDRLAEEAMRGDALCSASESVLVTDPSSDPDFPSDSEFFGPYDDDEPVA